MIEKYQTLIKSLNTQDADFAARVVNSLSKEKDLKDKLALEIREIAEVRLAAEENILQKVKWLNVIRDTYLLRAYNNLHDYLIYLEWNRDKDKKFYLPRSKVLRVVVDNLQDLEEGKFDILAVSLPTRTGKSTLGVMFMTWAMGRNPLAANVMSGHSDKLTDGFYREILSIITDEETYNWAKVFPNSEMIRTSAKDESIDLVNRKRFPTLTCRSIEGTLTGAVEAANYLYCDDLVSDLEEAINPIRLDSKYDAYVNQLKDRKKMNAKEIHIGTRWAVGDPIGRIRETYADNPRYREIVIPALDENDESNFDYPYGLGFDTAYYHDMRLTVDQATWAAKYMGEPYNREGLLFPSTDLDYYNGELPPESELARIYAAGDIAWGGGDFTAMPIIYEYVDGSRYLVDVAFNNGNRDITQPIIAGKLMKHNPHRTVFEANNGGAEYARSVESLIIESGRNINIVRGNKPNTKAKLSRIIKESPSILRVKYLERGKRAPDYEAFMNQLTSFTQNGKNKFDDAADSMAMVSEMRIDNGGSITFLDKGL